MMNIKNIIQCCKSAQLIGIEKEHQPIGFKKWFQLKLHTLYCSYCKRFLQQSKQINGFMQQLQQNTATQTLSQQKKQQIEAEINEWIANRD